MTGEEHVETGVVHEFLKFLGRLLPRTRSQVSLRSNIDRSEIDEFREIVGNRLLKKLRGLCRMAFVNLDGGQDGRKRGGVQRNMTITTTSKDKSGKTVTTVGVYKRQ